MAIRIVYKYVNANVKLPCTFYQMRQQYWFTLGVTAIIAHIEINVKYVKPKCKKRKKKKRKIALGGEYVVEITK